MKHFAIILILSCSLPILAQPYKPLIDNTNEWHFTSCFSGCFTDIYYTDGDTIVNGKSHKILDGYHYLSRGFLLREEVAEKKVYITTIIPGRIDEYLLYDFSLSEGDSIDIYNPITPFPQEGGYYVVDSIRFRPLQDNNDYRHYYLSPTASNTQTAESPVWIEGVGSLSIINAPGGTPDINDVGTLSCFFKNGTLFYSNLDSISGCESILGLETIKPSLDAVFITSDKINNRILVKNAQNVAALSIFSLNGSKIYQLDNTFNKQLEIDTSLLQNGLYILLAQTQDGQKRSFKVVVN